MGKSKVFIATFWGTEKVAKTVQKALLISKRARSCRWVQWGASFDVCYKYVVIGSLMPHLPEVGGD